MEQTPCHPPKRCRGNTERRGGPILFCVWLLPNEYVGYDEMVVSTARKTTAARALARVAADDPLSASRVRYLAGILGGARLAAFGCPWAAASTTAARVARRCSVRPDRTRRASARRCEPVNVIRSAGDMASAPRSEVHIAHFSLTHHVCFVAQRHAVRHHHRPWPHHPRQRKRRCNNG